LLSAVVAVLAVSYCPADAAEQHRNKRFAVKKIGKKTITVRQVKPSDRNLRGILPPAAEVTIAAERFFAAIGKLPEDFVKRTGIKYVTFLRQPTLKGIPIGGVAVGDTIVLSLSSGEGTIYHELFHVFDLHEGKAKKWNRINPKKFVYTGSVYYEAKLTLRQKKRKKTNLTSGAFKDDFVSSYAMSNELEDRAETFSCMMVEGKNFLRRVKKSAVMRNKMIYIINMTGRRGLMVKEFWYNHLGITKEDLSVRPDPEL
jgi:hypothetical protein